VEMSNCGTKMVTGGQERGSISGTFSKSMF
jgi:hypothetical protein